MSRFLCKKRAGLEAYVPGEQPRDRKYVKLNTNESPFPPSPATLRCLREDAELNLYPDPTCGELTAALADLYGLRTENVILGNGSDEILAFAFLAFCDEETPAVFADITYGFYPVFADLFGVPYKEIPLREDYTVDVDRFCAAKGTVVLANPNAPTGIALGLEEIECILRSDPDRVVLVDEAYVDFGARSASELLGKYENLLIVQTFSKSRSMAGARLGFALGSVDLIEDLNRVKYSFNPYNIDRLTLRLGAAAVADNGYYMDRCRVICENRVYTAEKLRALGFELTDSRTNFLFARHPEIPGGKLYAKLRERGVLVRHFGKDRIADHVRITVGSREEMETLLRATEAILKEESSCAALP